MSNIAIYIVEYSVGGFDLLWKGQEMTSLQCSLGDRVFLNLKPGGGPVAKTLSSQSRGPRFDPWLENETWHAIVKSSLFARPTLCNPVDCVVPGIL